MKLLRPDWPFAPNRCPIFYGWFVVAAGMVGVVMSVPGQTMGVSVFTDSLLGALGLTRGQLSAAYMLGTLASALVLPLAGRLYDVVGARISAAIASAVLALVLVLLSKSDAVAAQITAVSGLNATAAAFVVVLPAFFALRLSGQGVLTMASHNMIASWFDRRRGTVCGIAGVFTALGFSIAPLVLDHALRTFGWRGAWQLLAALTGFVFLPVVLAIYRDNPRECGLEPDGHHRQPGERGNIHGPAQDWTLRQARRTGLFWIFSLTFALSALYNTGLTFHIVSVFETTGMTRANAVSIFLPASAVAVTVHLSGGWLSDRIPLTRLLALMHIGLGLSMIGLMWLAPGWPVACIIVGNGLAGGLFSLLSAVSWARFFGLRHLGSITGLNMAIIVFYSALGPMMFSQSLAWTGSYASAGTAGLVAALALLAGSFVIHRRYYSIVNFRPAQQANAAKAVPETRCGG